MTESRFVAARRRAGSLALHATLDGLSRSLRVLPRYRAKRWGIERVRNIAYGGGGSPTQHLDVYRPLERSGPLPVVLYVHGGGFRILSKDSHWIFGYRFARAGYVVFNIDYRLATSHPYPAGLHDVFAAWRWVQENAAAWGGDPAHVVVAGESAGGNLLTSLTLASCTRFDDDPAAAAVFDLGAVPAAALPACPMAQVEELHRFDSEPPAPLWIRDRIVEVATGYTRGTPPETPRALASPLLVLESDRSFERPLPPFFVPCGGGDPIVADSVAMGAALAARDVPHQAPLYGDKGHAFHALGGDEARACWRDTFSFLDHHAPYAG